MRICKIWDADYPWDVRVEKVVNTLTQEGWHVDLVCRNEKRLTRLERNGDLHIHRLPCLPPALGRFNRLLNFPYFFNPVWVHNILHVVRESRPDVILIRDLPLAITGICVGRALGVPIVLDMAENYPAMLRDMWRAKPFRISNFFVRNPRMADWIERYAIFRADHIIVVVEESASRLVRLGVDPVKISVVSNTPADRHAENINHLPKPGDLPAGDPVIMYLGNLDPGRGVEILIAAMPAVLRVAPHAHLVIIGTGSHLDFLRSRAVQLQVEESVTLLGWLPHTLAQSYLSHADICVIPHDSTDSNNTTISNKLFDYMAAGKPVVVSACPPTARIVRSVGCGLVFPSRDPVALAERIGELLSASTRDAMGAKGKHAIRTEYNWERDSQVLVEVLSTAGKRNPVCPLGRAKAHAGQPAN